MAHQHTVCVIGGGAAGIMAAIFAARKGADVTLLESSDRFGKKILRSGNGRCNLSNLNDPAQAYFGSDPAFAGQILDGFSVEKTLAFFHEIGVLTKADQNNWVYPRSGRAQTVLTKLLRAMERQGVHAKTNAHVRDLQKTADGFLIQTDDWSYQADAVILACGSAAARKKNSYDISFLQRLGLPSIEAYPVLVPLYAKDPAGIAAWDGVRIDACVSLLDAQANCLAKTEGQLQLTKDGLSGIPVFDLSCTAVPLLRSGEALSAGIDFAPSETQEALRSLLNALQENDPQAGMKELLQSLYPEGLAEVLAGDCSSVEDVLARCKSFLLPLRGGGGMQKAQVAGGGFLTSSIDPKSCASKSIPGLYICGELLDINGCCGGWNLQFAWSTGALAGMAAAGACS